MKKDMEGTAMLTGKVIGVDTNLARDLLKRTGYPTVDEQADPTNVLSVHPAAIAKGQGLACDRLGENSDTMGAELFKIL